MWWDNKTLETRKCKESDIRGQFLENWVQLLHPAPNFLIALSGKEDEHQKMTNFLWHYGFVKQKMRLSSQR